MSANNENLQLIQNEKQLAFRSMGVHCAFESRDLKEDVRSTLVKLLLLLYSRRHEDAKKVAA
jgi:hypothetical protein